MWFKKKGSEAMPELPELPELPESPSISNKTPINNLPDIDNLSLNRDEKKSFLNLPSFDKNKLTNETIKLELKEKPKYTREIASVQREERVTKEVESNKEQEVKSMRRFQPSSTQEPHVFVRLDKFQNAVKNLSEIRAQLEEIESILAEIKSIKSRENQEMDSWEQELLDIKTKLESIDRGVFSRLE